MRNHSFRKLEMNTLACQDNQGRRLGRFTTARRDAVALDDFKSLSRSVQVWSGVAMTCCSEKLQSLLNVIELESYLTHAMLYCIALCRIRPEWAHTPACLCSLADEYGGMPRRVRVGWHGVGKYAAPLISELLLRATRLHPLSSSLVFKNERV